MKRANLNVLIISKGYGALKKAEKIETKAMIVKMSIFHIEVMIFYVDRLEKILALYIKLCQNLVFGRK